MRFVTEKLLEPLVMNALSEIETLGNAEFLLLFQGMVRGGSQVVGPDALNIILNSFVDRLENSDDITFD